MKAMIYKEYGSADVLQLVEVAIPVPKENEVLIKVHSTTVTPLDWKFRNGEVFIARLMSGPFKPKNPILGTEISGEIVKTGEMVKSLKEDDKVFAMISGGGYAEYICLPEDKVLKIPKNMTLEEAATVPFGAITAYHFLVKEGGIQKGQKVLINGASGGVGIFAVQLAKYFGTEVTAVCSGANVNMVKSLGADKVIDYTKEDFTQSDEKYDIVFDVVAKSQFKACKNILKKNGVFIVTVITFPILFQMLGTSITKGKKVKFGMPTKQIEILGILKSIIEEGKLKTVIGKRYPLSEIREAHKYAEKGHAKAKVAININ